MDVYHHVKFHPDRIRGFVSAHARFRASNCLLGYFFVSLGVLQIVLQLRRPHWFWRKIRQKTPFRASMWRTKSGKPKVKVYTPFAPKTAILGPVFDGTFSLENAFNIGHVLSKLPLIKSSTAETPARILTQNTSKDAVQRKYVPFGGRKTKS